MFCLCVMDLRGLIS